MSQDVDPPLGVPDECVNSAPSPTAPDNWSDPIWGFSGKNPYPDNDLAVAGQHVTLAGSDSDLLLNVSAKIESLRILNGASLRVTQGGNVAGSLGDLIIDPANAGNILVQGDALGGEESRTSLFVAGERRIDVTGGTVTIDTSGIYAAQDPNDPTVSASLVAKTIVVRASCPDSYGGELSLSANMTATTTENFFIDGSENLGENCTCVNAATSTQVAGGETPPIVRVKGSATLTVGGNLILSGNATASVEDGASLDLAGDFRNEVFCPDVSNELWSMQRLRLNNPAAVQEFEVAGFDRGRSAQGFLQNFAIGDLEISLGGRARFVDRFDNRRRVGGRSEALYVSRLAAAGGVQIVVDNCTVYYGSLDLGAGAAIERVGTGQLLCLASGDFDCDGVIDLGDFKVMATCWNGPGTLASFSCRVFDDDLDGRNDLKDFTFFQRQFSRHP